MNAVKQLALLTACAVLGACATKRTVQPSASTDRSMVELNEVAREATNTLGKLSFAHNAEAASLVTPEGLQSATLAATAEPVGWDQKVSLDYEGPFHILVERLSLKAGYRYALYGHSPASAPLVDVSVKDKALIEVLRDIVAQVPNTVRINVYPATKSITVSYRG
jgi:hypothetical protein